MCRICGRYICRPACPMYIGESAEWGKPISSCALCGGSICEYEDIRYSYGKPYCTNCFKLIKEKEKYGD